MKKKEHDFVAQSSWTARSTSESEPRGGDRSRLGPRDLDMRVEVESARVSRNGVEAAGGSAGARLEEVSAGVSELPASPDEETISELTAPRLVVVEAPSTSGRASPGPDDSKTALEDVPLTPLQTQLGDVDKDLLVLGSGRPVRESE